MLYPTTKACTELLFPYIRARMASEEPAPDYESECKGIERLGSILEFMQRPEYDSLLGKAAYLFCSIIDGHHFSNGNKRLAVSALVYFLLANGCRIHAPNMEVMRSELERAFPDLRWDDVQSFSQPHEFFFYHLALIIADRTQKGAMNFQQEQEAVATMLQVIVLK
jgi:death-on-curing family protein|tara:strand:- start:314 stop:811 length:498 start_codon:yes stop_codon:yes gene_type:complete